MVLRRYLGGCPKQSSYLYRYLFQSFEISLLIDFGHELFRMEAFFNCGVDKYLMHFAQSSIEDYPLVSDRKKRLYSAGTSCYY